MARIEDDTEIAIILVSCLKEPIIEITREYPTDCLSTAGRKAAKSFIRVQAA